MKIGMILDADFPPDPRVENEAATLIKAGHQVHLYCLDYTHKLPKSEIISGIQVYRAHLPLFIYKLSALAYTLPLYHLVMAVSIYLFARRRAIDSFHVHDMQIARSVFWVNDILKLPLVLDLHENRPEIMKHYYHVNTKKGRLLIKPETWKKFEFNYIKKADRVITVTQEAADYYLENLPVPADKFCIVPNTIRQAFHTDYVPDESIISSLKNSFTLLYVGDTGLRRGLLTVLESLDKLIVAIPKIKIVIVGNSKEDVILKDYVAEHNYRDYVVFTGWQDFSFFQSYILGATVGICPIHKNLHHDTTYANKIFQYMGFGKPLVVSNCISQQNMVEKYQCGLVFTDRDSDDFANKVITLANNPELYQQLSQNATQAIQNDLNWENTSKSMLSMYEEIAERL